MGSMIRSFNTLVLINVLISFLVEQRRVDFVFNWNAEGSRFKLILPQITDVATINCHFSPSSIVRSIVEDNSRSSPARDIKFGSCGFSHKLQGKDGSQPREDGGSAGLICVRVQRVAVVIPRSGQISRYWNQWESYFIEWRVHVGGCPHVAVRVGSTFPRGMRF